MSADPPIRMEEGQTVIVYYPHTGAARLGWRDADTWLWVGSAHLILIWRLLERLRRAPMEAPDHDR